MKPALLPIDIARQVQEARQGSQAAFAWLYRGFAPLVHAIHLGMASRGRVDDLAQETFVIAFARLDQLREPARFGPWIATIARRNRTAPAIDAVVDIADCDEPAWPGAGPEAITEAGTALQAIRRLPEAYRETLILRLVEGLSGPEIAELTGLTPQSVRVNLHRGMRQLRAALGIAAPHEERDDDRET